VAGTNDDESLFPESWAKSHPEAIRDSRQEARAARKTTQANRRNLRRPKQASSWPTPVAVSQGSPRSWVHHGPRDQNDRDSGVGGQSTSHSRPRLGPRHL